MPHFPVKPISEDTELKYSLSHLVRISARIRQIEEKLKLNDASFTTTEQKYRVASAGNGGNNQQQQPRRGRGRQPKPPRVKKKKARYSLSRLVDVHKELRRQRLDNSVEREEYGAKQAEESGQLEKKKERKK